MALTKAQIDAILNNRPKLAAATPAQTASFNAVATAALNRPKPPPATQAQTDMFNAAGAAIKAGQGLTGQASITARTGAGNPLDTYVKSRQLGNPTVDPPSGLMATDPDVLKAYQTMMGYNNQADVDTASLKRKLADALTASKQNRGKSLTKSNISFSDRGILNSGIALGQNADLNTAYDSSDSGLTNNFNANLSDIARKKLGYSQDYSNSKIGASAKQAKAQADAQAAALQAQQQAAQIQQQQADLIAALNPVPAPVAATPVDTSYADAANAYAAAIKATAKPKAVASKKALPKLVLKGGPQ